MKLILQLYCKQQCRGSFQLIVIVEMSSVNVYIGMTARRIVDLLYTCLCGEVMKPLPCVSWITEPMSTITTMLVSFILTICTYNRNI